MDSLKDEKTLTYDAEVLPVVDRAAEGSRAEADIELAETHEGEFGTKRDLVSHTFTHR